MGTGARIDLERNVLCAHVAPPPSATVQAGPLANVVPSQMRQQGSSHVPPVQQVHQTQAAGRSTLASAPRSSDSGVRVAGSRQQGVVTRFVDTRPLRTRVLRASVPMGVLLVAFRALPHAARNTHRGGVSVHRLDVRLGVEVDGVKQGERKAQLSWYPARNHAVLVSQWVRDLVGKLVVSWSVMQRVPGAVSQTQGNNTDSVPRLTLHLSTPTPSQHAALVEVWGARALMPSAAPVITPATTVSTLLRQMTPAIAHHLLCGPPAPNAQLRITFQLAPGAGSTLDNGAGAVAQRMPREPLLFTVVRWQLASGAEYYKLVSRPVRLKEKEGRSLCLTGSLTLLSAPGELPHHWGIEFKARTSVQNPEVAAGGAVTGSNEGERRERLQPGQAADGGEECEMEQQQEQEGREEEGGNAGDVGHGQPGAAAAEEAGAVKGLNQAAIRADGKPVVCAAVTPASELAHKLGAMLVKPEPLDAAAADQPVAVVLVQSPASAPASPKTPGASSVR